jgi:hypothetical protein
MTIHQATGHMSDAVIKQSAIEKSFDNLTVVMVCFKNIEAAFNTRPLVGLNLNIEPTPQ